MFIFKLISYLILPGTTLVLLSLVGLILLIKTKKQRLAVIVLIVSSVMLYLFSISPIADLLLYPLENKHSKIQDSGQTETIIMLTGGEEGNVLRAREVLRLYYARKNDNTKIIISGNDPLTTSDQKESSAEQVKTLLTESGINPEIINTETDSRTTFESAQNLNNIIRQDNFFLVTSGYHMPRAMMIFKAFDTRPIPAPTDFKIGVGYNLFSFLPSPGNLKKTDYAIHEYIGIIYYKLKILVTNLETY